MKGSSHLGELERLAHRVVDAGNGFDSLVEERVDTGRVAAHQAQLTSLFIARDERPEVRDKLPLLGSPERMGEPRHRRQNIHGRIAALIRDRAIKHNVAVEHPPNGVGDRIVVIVAVDQHGKDPGDRTGSFFAGPGSLEQPRQIAEHARCVTARHRRLACRERHVAGGVSEPGHRVDDEQHRLATITEILGDRCRCLRCKSAHHRTLVAGRNDRDG